LPLPKQAFLARLDGPVCLTATVGMRSWNRKTPGGITAGCKGFRMEHHAKRGRQRKSTATYPLTRINLPEVASNILAKIDAAEIFAADPRPS
jgi:hypothetical protein